MAAGALIGGIAGIGQGKRAKQLEKDYQNAENAINPVDPNQVAYLNKVRQQERNFRGGSDPSSAFAAMNARNVGGQTMANISRAGGPGVVGNLLRAQAGTNQAIAGIGANAGAQANQMLALQGGLIDRMADKVYQRQVERRNQAMERSVSARQNIQNTFQGALAMVPGIAGGINFGKMGGGQMGGRTQWTPNTSAVQNFDFTQARYQAPQMTPFQPPPQLPLSQRLIG
jgi:hypothetical protein